MQLNETKSQTIEQVLFERMGVSVEGAFATGADFVDETASKAASAGVDVEPRLSSLLSLLMQLTEPENMKALQTLIGRLPQLAELAKLTDALSAVQEKTANSKEKQKLGMFGLLGALKNPDVQKAVAFAAQFGEEFGKTIDTE